MHNIELLNLVSSSWIWKIKEWSTRSLISNFQSEVENETKLTSGKWVNCPTPLPSGISRASDPPAPRNFQFPPWWVWIFPYTVEWNQAWIKPSRNGEVFWLNNRDDLINFFNLQISNCSTTNEERKWSIIQLFRGLLLLLFSHFLRPFPSFPKPEIMPSLYYPYICHSRLARF